VKILLFANTDWYLYNFRLSLAAGLCDHGHEVVLLSPPGDYSGRFSAVGLHWEPFPFSRRGMNPFQELLSVLKLSRSYRSLRPDLVHHFTMKSVLYGSLAAKISRVRGVVNSIEGLGYIFVNKGRLARVLRVVMRPLFRFAMRGTQVIFLNPDDQDAFLQAKIVTPQQVTMVRSSGVETIRFSPMPEEPGIPVVVLASRMLWDKGVAEFVEAARILTAEGVQARFILVGDRDPSNPDAVPAAQLETWREEGPVEWWGWQDDMPSVFARSHVVCLPSFYGEGVPKTLLEASACQRAVVTTDMPGCREAVQHGQNGLLVPARDAPALADAVRQLLQEPALRRSMGLCGRMMVEKEFSAERIIQETLTVYQNTLDERVIQ
jgi:glycosyltransferase involved in cell wall biosynthesis